MRGFTNAARIRFNKSLHALDEEGYIGLVAMLIAPNTVRPDLHGDACRERVARFKRVLSGACRARGVLDPWYSDCASRSL
ncbi:MAG: hypothetical protein ACTSYE_09390 [Alphaproteobacteria bacterium]